ncbi:amino acid/polyamine transporter I [Aspergillus heterothallicus]
MTANIQDEHGKNLSPFGLWSAVSLGWLTLNAFGALSFILFVGLSAGGLPSILYGYIGSGLAVTCLILTLAQCAARYSTAGGAYHYSCFLIPPQYRRQISYPLGWINYLGWILTHAACCAIVATSTLGLVNLCHPGFAVTTRWHLFLVYLGVAGVCWLLNLRGLRSIPTLELLGCYVTIAAFIAYTVLLLVKAPKASARSVFVETDNQTGYSSTSFAIFLGLFTSFSTLISLEGPCHIAEEIPTPKRFVPRILLIVILSQLVVGVVWIIVLGFSITNVEAVMYSPTGIPVLELIRLATSSDGAAMAFAITLMVNNGTSALGSAVAMSRQGYAFARDGGLFWNSKLIERSSATKIPMWSINLPSFVVVLIGLIYLFSDAAFNAIIGAQAVCMIISLAFPALTLLFTRERLLPTSRHWSLGVFSVPMYLISVGYALLVVVVAMIPQKHPITVGSMNHTVTVIGAITIAMTLAWVFEGRKSYSPPLNPEEYALPVGTMVLEGGSPVEEIDQDEGHQHGSDVKGAAKNVQQEVGIVVG